MRYSIQHQTTYDYESSVILLPHTLRLRPRSDSWQTLETFEIQVSPKPIGISEGIGLDGNPLIKLWFEHVPCDRLDITVRSIVETHQENPFIYLLDPFAMQLPIDYPASLKSQLQSYLRSQDWVDPVAVEIAQNLLVQVDGSVMNFLTQLNQLINAECHYGIREMGRAFPPGVTWRDRKGSCRDFTVLFIEVCRAVGLAARFVSGYQEGDLDRAEHDLHAWAEVYLPGAGWRGYDPTLGLVVGDRHIALVASPDVETAAPVVGNYRPAESTGLMPRSMLRSDVRLWAAE